MIRSKTDMLRLFFCLVLFLISACSSNSYLVNTDKIPGERCIVFGKFTLNDEGDYLRWNSYYSEFRHLFIILPPEPSKPAISFLTGEGYFYWDLSPGEYTLACLVPYKGLDFFLHAEMIRTRFTVPDGADSVYIGELIVNKNKRRYSSEIQYDFANAIADLEKRYPLYRGKTITQNMVDFKAGRYDSVEPICSHDWGIGCGQNERDGLNNYYFSGIHPITPKINPNAIWQTLIYTVKPKFSWQPSQDKNISYDLIVYEAVELDPIYQRKLIAPGKVVLYKEDLKSPNYQLLNKLKPRTRYYWTVRLRRNNTVSTWSRFNYSSEGKPAMMAGFNQMFSFVTPLFELE